ncbi:MAG TPA: redoxin domain-containing protein [Flavipsychrobacter sp.]|nr:redoxin domain-containing protein [Flavipsychrobacter sp.]
MAIAIGSKAPDFKLPNTDKKEITLADFAGKKLIINFFPAAFTGVCTEQVCSNNNALNAYQQANAAVVGVSVDMAFSLGVFKTQNNVSFDLLSDFNKQMIRDYDFYLEDFALGYKGVARRGVVVVDENGIVIHSEATANPGTQIDFEALNKALAG